MYVSEKKAIASYKADFSKSPVRFFLVINNRTETISLESHIKFVNDDLIQWQVFESDKRPAHFSQRGGQIDYLKRKK